MWFQRKPEYMIKTANIDSGFCKDEVENLKILVENGWELISVRDEPRLPVRVYYFKRWSKP